MQSALTNVIGTGQQYTGGGIKNTFHGVSYQMKLAMLYIVRGLQQDRKFQIGTEVEEAGKFDDLLFLHEDNEIGLFQAKHRLNENSLIYEKQLLCKEGDFSILKYFHSYCQILNNNKLENVLKGRVITLILQTNIGFDSSILNNFQISAASSRLTGNKIIALGTDTERAKYYSIIKSSTLYNKLVDLLLNLEQPSVEVAENLAKAVVNNNKKIIHNDTLFDTCCNWLLDNVLEVDVEGIKTQNRYYVIFKDSFFSASESSVVNFRKTFLDTYMLNKRIGKKGTKSVEEDLSGVKFKIPRKVYQKVSKIAPGKGKGDDDVQKFLDILVFAVNQPNETMLGDIIEKEIADYIGHTVSPLIAPIFILYIQEWVKRKESRYLTNKDIEQQFAVWGQETLNESRMHDVKKCTCTFKDCNRAIKSLSDFLKTENDANVFSLYSREQRLSKIIVRQVLESFISERKDQKFIFGDEDDLNKLIDTKICPLKAFSSQTCNVIFVSLQEGKSGSTDILNRLLQIVEESKCNAEPHFVKRLIISIPEKEKSDFVNKFCFNNPAIKSISLDDFDNSFSDLDEKSRQQVRNEGCIRLHGKNIMSSLTEDELSLCIKDEMLFKLILSGLEINDGWEIFESYYKEQVNQYYVDRFLAPVIVDQEITKDTQFHIVRQHTIIENAEVVVISSNEELFEQLRKTNDNVHWLKERNGKYMWINSQGTLSNLRKHVVVQDLDPDCDPENDIPITNISDLKNDVVLISASPGMGKSILLSYIAEQAKKDTSSAFVFKINLVDYCTKLDSLNEERVTLKEAIHFAFVAMQVESRQVAESESAFNLLTVQEDGSLTLSPDACFSNMDHLRALVFCNLYNKEKITLLLDGFDQIAPDYCKTTSILLQKLKRSKLRKMWVTTRPYAITKSLENDLETFAYTLKPLPENNQLTLMDKLWKCTIRYQKISSVKDFLNSINMSTLSALHKAEKKQNSNNKSPSFMGVPLHCYMLAKVLKEDFKKFCSQDKYTAVPSNTIQESFTIFDLYSKFFDIKFDEILYKNVDFKDPKNVIFRDKKKDKEIDHGKLALLEIFQEKLPTELVAHKDRDDFLGDVNSGKEKLGVVVEVVDNKPQFVHRTFAEYFAAHYLAKILTSPVENKRKDAAKSLLYKSITGNPEYYNVLFSFFNYIVVSNGKNKDIFEAAIAGNIRKLSKIENINEMFDPLNRTPMHLIAINLSSVLRNFEYDCLGAYRETAAKMLYFNDFVFIQRVCQSLIKHSSDSLFTWTPTHYLTLCSVEYIIEKFPIAMQCFNDISQDILGRTPLMLLILTNFNSSSTIWISFSKLNFNLTCVNIQDNCLKTALHHALEMNKILLDKNTFIYTYFWNSKYENVETLFPNIILCLLRNGSRIDIPDDKGTTAVDMINLLFTERILEMFKKDQDLYAEYETEYCTSCGYLINLNYIADHVDEHVCNALSLTGTTIPHNEHRIKPEIKTILRYILLRELFCNYYQPFLPVVNSEAFTIFFLEMLPYPTAKDFIKIEEVLTLSTNNDDHKSCFIYMLNWTDKCFIILLLNFPYLIDVVDSKGRTALHYAIINRSRHKLISLIKRSARPGILDTTGNPPAHIHKCGELELLYRHDVISMFDLINELPYRVAKPLVLTMALFPPVTLFGDALIKFILNRYITIETVLWEKYSDLLRTTVVDNYYSYFNCAKVGNKVICNLLERYCVDDFSNSVKSNYILKSVVTIFSSVEESNLSRLRKVLYPINTEGRSYFDKEFMVNARTKDGQTALHLAAKIGNAEIVKCLLSYGAWYNVPDHDGTTPAEIAEIRGNTTVLHLLNVIEQLFHCLYFYRYAIARNIIEDERIDYEVCNCRNFKHTGIIETVWKRRDQTNLKSLHPRHERRVKSFVLRLT